MKKKDSIGLKKMRRLEVVSPVPADIDIANSVEPLHVSEIAKQLNLSPDHYDLYGKYKAKVSVFVIWVIKKQFFECFLSSGLSRFLHTHEQKKQFF